jgi:hypothetical protein
VNESVPYVVGAVGLMKFYPMRVTRKERSDEAAKESNEEAGFLAGVSQQETER